MDKAKMKFYEEQELHVRKKLLSLINYDVKKLRKRESAFKGGKELVKNVERLVAIDDVILDKWYNRAYKMEKNDRISAVNVFWMTVVLIAIFLFIGISIGIGYMAIADLEECVYHGNCIQTPKTKE